MPVVQGGITEQVTVANLTAGRSVAAQALSLSNTETYLGLTATNAGGKLWYVISGGGGNVSPGYLAFYNGTNNNKVFTIAASTTEQFVTDTSGNFQLVTGNLVVSSGKGIDFSATAGTGTSELFSDYEEGTWTPASGVGSATSNSGVYTKTGRQVTVIGTLTFPVQTNAGLATITGLPFTSGTTGSGGTLRYTDFGSAFFLYGNPSAATIGCYTTAGAGISYTTISGKRVDFAMTYFV